MLTLLINLNLPETDLANLTARDRYFSNELVIEYSVDSGTKPLASKQRREIDERDIDLLLAALTDRQISDTFGWGEAEVAQLRRSRLKIPPVDD